MPETMQKLVNDLVGAWNSHNVDRAAEFYSPDYVGNDMGQSNMHRGRDGLREFLSTYLSAFPDLKFSADETIIADNHVALAWTAQGTHRGAILKIPPTGRTISIRGVSLLTIENETVKRASYFWDVAGLLRAVGLLPEL
ncbi:MAG: ester cyclase [Chloroflexota bacterium]|nr:ester cyclase [Chloroflexota bacterium]